MLLINNDNNNDNKNHALICFGRWWWCRRWSSADAPRHNTIVPTTSPPSRHQAVSARLWRGALVERRGGIMFLNPHVALHCGDTMFTSQNKEVSRNTTGNVVFKISSVSSALSFVTLPRKMFFGLPVSSLFSFTRNTKYSYSKNITVPQFLLRIVSSFTLKLYTKKVLIGLPVSLECNAGLASTCHQALLPLLVAKTHAHNGPLSGKHCFPVSLEPAQHCH